MEHFFSTYRADGFIDLFQNDDTCRLFTVNRNYLCKYEIITKYQYTILKEVYMKNTFFFLKMNEKEDFV